MALPGGMELPLFQRVIDHRTGMLIEMSYLIVNAKKRRLGTGRRQTCAKSGGRGDEEAALGFGASQVRPKNFLSATKVLNKSIKF